MNGIGVREHAKNLDVACNPLVVTALEAPGGHLRRDAVPVVVCTPEAEGGATGTGRIHRREQECAAFHVVGGVETDLCVDVAPVARNPRECALPRVVQRRLGREVRTGRFVRRDEFDLADGAGVIQPSEHPPHQLRARPAATPRDREQNPGARPARVHGAEQGSGAMALLVLLDRQRQSRLGPVVRQLALDLVELTDEWHGPEHKLDLVAKVEQKGTLSSSDLRDFFREMMLIRRFEEKVEERFRAGELPGFLHVAIGQEAVAVGVCRALEENDVIASTHRAHGHTLAKGTTPNELMAELYGKLEGCSHGYGGSMHLYDIERGTLGANAVVGGGLPAIVGATLAFKFRSEPRVAVAFFGDGATNIGTFHEALNLAQLWGVPAVFVCENNHWAESTPGWQHMPIEDISQRAVAYGMKAMKVDGQDVEAVYKTARRALEHARSGKGPVFVAAETFRLVGHYIGDPQVYRSKEELQETRQTQDPLDRLRAKLELTDDEVEEIDREVQDIVEASVEFAKNGTDPKPEDALKNVYA